MQTLQALQSGALLGTKRLKLSCGLKTFPKEIYTLADTLEILDLSGNELSSLPDDFGVLKNLKIAFFSDNFFTEFPAVLAECAELEMIGFKANIIKIIPENAIPINTRWLILTNNAIESIPASIGNCTRMQKLMLAGNRLKALPKELSACKNLELFRISANQIEQFPEELLTFPRLSWLAFAGNPFSENTEEQVSLEEFSWDELIIKEQLGEGASGIIAKAEWKTHNREIAVKVYKGEVTSDGLPTNEMNACISAGTHPNLVTVLGKIKNHPNNKHGLLMELIPPTFRNLGGPPSFETCTRDTYSSETVFSLQEIIKISSSIASVGAQLHSLGVSHGDLYAHNTLVDEQANTLFGDFGAGSTYHVHSSKAPAIQRLEVRAFACLLDDLLRYIQPAEAENVSVILLQSLVKACMNEVVLARPSFEEIYQTIKELYNAVT